MEFDVQQARDGELVVVHDTNLRRVAGVNATVASRTGRQLAALDAGSWFSDNFRGERIPTLRETMQLVAGLDEIHLEIKQPSRRYRGIERRVLSLLRARRGWMERTVISSFDFGTLRRVRALNRRARIGWLAATGSARSEVARARELGAESVHIPARKVSRRWAREAHANGMKLYAYTINDWAGLRRLRSLGADGAFSNHPELPAGAGVAR